MQRTKFYIQVLVVLLAFLASCGLQAKNDFLESCNKQSDCKSGLKCSPVSTLAKNKICKKGVGQTCYYDTECGNGLVCAGPRKTICKKDFLGKEECSQPSTCITGCVSEANCIGDQVCRGFISLSKIICSDDDEVSGWCCKSRLGKCYNKQDAGAKGALCRFGTDCKSKTCLGAVARDPKNCGTTGTCK